MEQQELTPEQVAQNWIIWLDALESGEYKKTIKKLHALDEDGVERHCCLGVAQICLGLKRDGIHAAVDYRLTFLLGLHQSVGISHSVGNHNKAITNFNDDDYKDDVDFTNIRRTLIDDLEGFTHLHPQVASLVRKILMERQEKRIAQLESAIAPFIRGFEGRGCSNDEMVSLQYGDTVLKLRFERLRELAEAHKKP